MKTRSIAFRLVAVALSLTLTGCIFFETPRQRAMRNDPNFKAGYSDGCASGNERGTSYGSNKIRDDAAFETSQPYRAGWNAGYTTCNSQFNPNPNPNVNGPDQRPNP